jgi:hypothetical protein
MPPSFLKSPFPECFLSVNSAQNACARQDGDVVDGLSIELKVKVRKIPVKSALNRPIKACSAVSYVDHGNFEALVQNAPEKLLDSLVRDCCNILPFVCISPEDLV